MSTDSTTAYESHAQEFLRVRDKSTIGVEITKRWARSLDPATDVLEIACGGGLPVTRTLIDEGLNVWAVDSSPTLVEAFQARFPSTPVQCDRVQESEFFGRKFGAVVAIGLVFLLKEDDQVELLRRVSDILVPDGRFLFTAPVKIGTWADITTGYECRSLGRERYVATLEESGFRLIDRYADEGRNNYYDAQWIAGPAYRKQP